MAQIYTNFPGGMKDAEISRCIGEYTNEIIQSRAQTNKVLQFTPLIQLGEYELAKRQTRRITRLTIGVSVVSLFIAIAALTVSWLNTKSSEAWEAKQTAQLEKLNAELAATREEIMHLTSSITSHIDALANKQPIAPAVRAKEANQAIQTTGGSDDSLVIPRP